MEKKEYIERGALDMELQNLVREYNENCESDKSSGAFEALYRLRLAPAADVAPMVHGDMNGFIEIHTTDGKAHYVNIRHIVEVTDNIVYTDDIAPQATDFPNFKCLETYEEICAKIRRATDER